MKLWKITPKPTAYSDMFYKTFYSRNLFTMKYEYIFKQGYKPNLKVDPLMGESAINRA